jgi:hypothetical protein
MPVAASATGRDNTPNLSTTSGAGGVGRKDERSRTRTGIVAAGGARAALPRVPLGTPLPLPPVIRGLPSFALKHNLSNSGHVLELILVIRWTKELK